MRAQIMSCSTTDGIPSYKDTARAGDDYKFELRVKIKETGNFRDFTGYTFSAQLKEKVTSLTVTENLTCTLLTDQNTISCKLTNAQTDNLVSEGRLFTNYVYSIKGTSPTAVEETILDVEVKFTRGATA